MAVDVGQKSLSRKYLGAEHTDISAASVAYAVCPEAGQVVKVWATLHAALTSADAVVTMKRIRAGGTPATMANGTLTVVQASSAAGLVFSCAPTGPNSFVEEGDVIVFDSDGASSTTARVTYTVELETAP